MSCLTCQHCIRTERGLACTYPSICHQLDGRKLGYKPKEPEQTETTERTLYRMACKHYLEPQGLCARMSHCKGGGKFTIGYKPYAIDFGCTEDAKCPRMRRYDKIHKYEKRK